MSADTTVVLPPFQILRGSKQYTGFPNRNFLIIVLIQGGYSSAVAVLCVAEKGVLNYAAKSIDKQKHLQTNGRWNGVVWYSDEQSSKKRKSFCGTSKQEVKDKITAYLADFDRQLTASDESKAKFEESMGKWLRVFKFPSVERGTYDRLECTAKYQIYRSSAARWWAISPRQISKPC